MLRPPPLLRHASIHTPTLLRDLLAKPTPFFFFFFSSMKRERERGLVNLISTDQRRGNNKPTLGINRWIISVIYYNSPSSPHILLFALSFEARRLPAPFEERNLGFSFVSGEFHKFPDPRIPINPTARVIRPREGWFPRAGAKYPEIRRYYCFHPCIL